MAEPTQNIPEADAQPVANGVAPDATTEPAVDSTAAADVTMADSQDPEPTPAQPTESTAQQPSSDEPTTAPPTTSTPAQPPAPTPAPAPSSRASPHPAPAQQQQPPVHPIPHGSPTRVYLNQHVTPHLLEAMKHLVTAEPEKPLLWLSEFLAGKSREIEG